MFDMGSKPDFGKLATMGMPGNIGDRTTVAFECPYCRFRDIKSAEKVGQRIECASCRYSFVLDAKVIAPGQIDHQPADMPNRPLDAKGRPILNQHGQPALSVPLPGGWGPEEGPQGTFPNTPYKQPRPPDPRPPDQRGIPLPGGWGPGTPGYEEPEPGTFPNIPYVPPPPRPPKPGRLRRVARRAAALSYRALFGVNKPAKAEPEHPSGPKPSWFRRFNEATQHPDVQFAMLTRGPGAGVLAAAASASGIPATVALAVKDHVGAGLSKVATSEHAGSAIEGTLQAAAGMAALGGPSAIPVALMLQFGSALAGGVERLRKWGDSLHEGNMKFAEFSASMTSVQARQEVREIHYSKERGEQRAATAEYLAEEKHRLQLALAPIEDAWANLKNRFAAAATGATATAATFAVPVATAAGDAAVASNFTPLPVRAALAALGLGARPGGNVGTGHGLGSMFEAAHDAGWAQHYGNPANFAARFGGEARREL